MALRFTTTLCISIGKKKTLFKTYVDMTFGCSWYINQVYAILCFSDPKIFHFRSKHLRGRWFWRGIHEHVVHVYAWRLGAHSPGGAAVIQKNESFASVLNPSSHVFLRTYKESSGKSECFLSIFSKLILPISGLLLVNFGGYAHLLNYCKFVKNIATGLELSNMAGVLRQWDSMALEKHCYWAVFKISCDIYDMFWPSSRLLESVVAASVTDRYLIAWDWRMVGGRKLTKIALCLRLFACVDIDPQAHYVFIIAISV